MSTSMFAMYICLIGAIIVFFMTLYDLSKNRDCWKYGAFIAIFNLMLAMCNGIIVLINTTVQ